ncbi:hypothetical protein [Pollutimonas harenae]|uniref:Uncharacterized protein n=1 Tax=Pollutimonas harenae TaxID=657015 RepID=A0A853GVJ2_9BURK|nr:hypothetical protein [Pollutimonas harenae]NYT84796.1 hypothetical protein [Pollutimonas harenae]TEA72805.1 hypothetical protein ERD84_02530 [Pollutimonas harenae]
MSTNRTPATLWAAIGFATLGLLGGCAPMVSGSMAEGGFSAAKSAFDALSPTAAGADERQKRIQAAFNEVNIGDDVQLVLNKIAEPPHEKTGNAQGYTCYEFPGVYSADEAAVLMAHEGKIVFYGNSSCSDEMRSVRGGEAGSKSGEISADSSETPAG